MDLESDSTNGLSDGEIGEIVENSASYISEDEKNEEYIGSDEEGGDIIDEQKKLMKTYIDEFCKLDDELRQLKFAVKERDKRLKELKGLIGSFMANNSVDFFNLQTGGSINLKQSMKFKSLNKNQTLELYSMFLGDKEKAIKLQNFLKTNREKVPSSNLVRKID